MSDHLTSVAQAICRETCAFKGEPACYDVAADSKGKLTWPPAACDDPGCMTLAEVAIGVGAAPGGATDREALIEWFARNIYSHVSAPLPRKCAATAVDHLLSALPSMATAAGWPGIETERLKSITDAMQDAHVTLAVAFDRIHTLPRTSDTELAERIGRSRARIASVLAIFPSPPAAPGDGR